MKIKDIYDLDNIVDEIIKVINNHLAKTGQSPSALAIEIGIHPLQLLGFLRGERGIHIDTIKKIGKKLRDSNKLK